MNSARLAFLKTTSSNRKKYHALKLIMNNIIGLSKISDPETVRILNPVIEQIEFQMQEVLGLPKNRLYHRYWMELDGCTCPYLDNMEAFGTEFMSYSDNCPYHGIENK